MFFPAGDAATSTLTLNNDIFTLTYTGGDRCRQNKDWEKFKSTEITLLCNRNIPVGKPRYLNKDSEACVYHFEWELAAACPPLEPSCQVIGEESYDPVFNLLCW